MTTKRKSKLATEAAEEVAKKLNELQKTYDNAIKEEEEIKASIENSIIELAKNNNFFCGVIIDKQNLLKLMELMIDAKEQIKIPFQLYYND